jgi:hypothetical protein
MSQSPLLVIIEMVWFIINNTVNAMLGVFKLFGKLIGSLEFMSAIGGSTGFFLSVVIIAVVVFFLGKFFLKLGKQVIILFVVSMILLWIFILSLI